MTAIANYPCPLPSIEHKYARPALEHFSEYFQTQPILTVSVKPSGNLRSRLSSISRQTWLAMTLTLFTIMSILPVLSFMCVNSWFLTP